MKPQKHVLQICPRLNSGGIERGVVDVAIALKKSGMQSTVLSGGGHFVQELTNAGVEHIEFPAYLKSPIAIFQNSRKLHRLLLTLQPDLVHAYSRAPIWTTHYALKSLNIPFVTSCHSPHGTGFFHLKKCYNRAITLGDTVISISDFITSYLKKNYDLPAHKITMIYRGIDTEYFNSNRFDEKKIKALKQQLHVPLDKTILLLPGRITRWKGQDVLIKALEKMGSTYPLHIIMVGRVDSEPFYQELLSLISRYHLEEHIQFVKESFDMPSLYALADITLSTSRKPEAFGRIAVEAQSMGSLVIASHLGAAEETIIPGQTGFLVSPDDTEQLANTIEHVLQLSTDARLTIQNQAKERVSALFTKEIMLKKTLALYQSLMPQ